MPSDPTLKNWELRAEVSEVFNNARPARTVGRAHRRIQCVKDAWRGNLAGKPKTAMPRMGYLVCP